MITENYCSFETSKLLNEKGFEGECSRIYSLIDEVDWQGDVKVEFCVGKSYPRSVYLKEKEFIPCPTLQMANKFVREKYGLYPIIYITEKIETDADGDVVKSRLFWTYEICHVDVCYIKGGHIVHHDITEYKTFESANDAEIQYCLTNLI